MADDPQLNRAPPPDKERLPAELRFLEGGGQMGRRMRSHDWSKSPLGDPASWEQSLKSVVGLLLTSKFPMFVAWGKDLGFLYNDPYAEILGAKHPAALGSKFYDIWSEIWPDISPLVDAAISGEATYREDLPLLMNRKGFDEQTYFTFSYSPIRGDDGSIAGMFCACTETTGKVVGEDLLANSEKRLRSLLSTSNQVLYRHNADWSEMRQLSGGGFLADTDAPDPNWFDKYIHPEDQSRIWDKIQEAVKSRTPFELEHRVIREDGALGWTHSRSIPILDNDGEIIEWFGAASDVTERKQSEELRLVENQILALAMEDRPLKETLEELVRIVERQSDEAMLGSILILSENGKHLLHGAAPSLPEPYNEAIDGIAIGPGVGSCGTAAHSGKRVFVSDIASDPLWKDYRELALANGLRACWSIPILATSGDVLGTFAMYYREPRDPHDEDLRLIDSVVRSASLIIERDQAKRKLEASEAQFRAVFEGAAVGMVEFDNNWNILSTNQAYRDIADRSADELLGSELLGFTHSDDLEASKEALQQAAEEAGRVTLEKRYLRKDGSAVWVRSNISRVSSPGEAPRFLKVIEDISERRSAEAALREESQRLEVLNRTGSALAELDLENVVQHVTDAGVELTGAQFGAFFYNVLDDQGGSYMLYTLSGAKRSDFERFPMPRNTAVFGPTFEGAGVVRSDDITNDKRYGKNKPYKGMPKGHLPVVSYLAVPVISRSGDVLGGLFFGHPDRGRFTARHERLMVGLSAQAAVAMDNAQLYREAQREIANRQKAEQALLMLNESLETRVADEVERRSQSEEALRQLQKMETVGQLTGGIAHDFNNLLQIIAGNLDIVRRGLPADSNRMIRSIENAMKGADRAAVLTQRLLAFSRRQPLAPKVLDPNKLVSGMSEMLHRTLGEHYSPETVLASGLWRVEADPNQLETAILNLAVNARDAMPTGGKLTIETANTHLDRSYTDLHSGTTPGQYVVMCVSDTGEGMTAEQVDRAFEPFYTTKGVGKGTGLGLSMVYGFVKQSGGHIKIYSELGEGTTVKIYLPRYLGTGPLVEDTQLEQPVPEGDPTATILVCEDDEDVRALSADSLRTLGYQVLEAADGESALRILEDGAEVDLLFTDVVLPGMTGAVLARVARALKPDLKVLFTTGYARNAIVHHGRLDPGVELLSKPFTYSELATRIRDILDGIVNSG